MSELTVGAVFGRYRIEDVAGRGGMGVVYRARQQRPDRVVALKIIVPDLSGDKAFRARFEAESEIAATIEHPNVIPVYDVGDADDRLYIAMRYVEGDDLGELIARGLNPERAARIVNQVGTALDAAHEHGLIHRDIKPANVLVAPVSGRDHAYLTDFGLAKHIASARVQTQTGQFVGTVDYAAPEQILGEPVDARADVYALTCVLYQALTGEVPYPRDSGPAKMWAHIHERPPSVKDADRAVPERFDDVIARGMARDPEDRYPSAGDLGRAAVAAARGAAPDPSGERSVAVGMAAPAPATPDSGEATVVGAGEDDPDSDAPTAAPGEDTGGPTIGPDTGAKTVKPDVATGARTAAAAPSATKSRKGLLIAGGAVLALVVVAVIAVVLLSGGDGDGDGIAPARVAGPPIPVGRNPDAIGAGGGKVWVANGAEGTASRIDAASATTAGPPVKVGSEPYGVAVGEGAVWIANFGDGTVTRLNPDNGKPIGRPIRVGRNPTDLAIGFGAVWVSNWEGGRSGSIVRIDPATGRAGPRIEVGAGAADVAVGEGSVWAASAENDTISRINPQTSEVLGAQIPVGDSPESIAVGGGSVWVANIKSDTVTRVDPVNNQVTGSPIPVGERPDDVVADETVLWVVEQDANTVSRIDLKTATPVGEPVPVGDSPAALALANGSAWIANAKADNVVRVQP